MANNKLEVISRHRCFGGTQYFYRHDSSEIGLPMQFSVFVPKQAESGKVPVLFYLAGLTCTEETFMIKAGAQRRAAELGIMLVTPDTSPRGAGVPGEDDDWDFGTGAGFYLDATQEPWSRHYRMESYVTKELFELATTELPGDAGRAGIFGHSHGRPWRACIGAAPSRPLQVGIGLCAHRSPHEVPLGREGVFRLPG